MLNVAKTGLRKETMVEPTFHYAFLLKKPVTNVILFSSPSKEEYCSSNYCKGIASYE